MIILKETITGPGGEDPGGGEEPPPPPVIVPTYGFGMRLITESGDDWDLAQGPVFALAGASGFGSPDPEHWWRVPVQIDGSFHQGLRIPAREVTLPLEVSANTSEGWLAADRALWKGLNPRSTVDLMVTTPEAKSRRLTLRLVNGGDVEYDTDPMLLKQALYPLTFMAGDPYWRGEHIEQVYGIDASPDATLFPGPPFNIGMASTIATGSVTNPGDEAAWPQWTITGPYSSATVGVGDSTVTMSTPVTAGNTRVIDTQRPSIRKGNGDDAWLEATEAVFEPIPPGREIPLSLSVSGSTTATTITLSFDARYRRAW